MRPVEKRSELKENMSFDSERLIELSAELDRVKARLKRLELGQAILVVSSDDLNSLAQQSGKSHPDCLYALRETGGDTTKASAFLESM